MKKEFNYPQKYRPTTVEDCILPKQIKKSFQDFVNDKSVPSLLLSGTHGVGKTTVAIAMCEELNIEYMLINASRERGVDMLRTRIADFAPMISLMSEINHKVIILDEADGLTPDAQAGIKGAIEEYSSNCSFIFTCNNKNKIIEPIQSRCINIHFSVDKKEKNQMMAQFMKRVEYILDEEGVKYNRAVLAQFITVFFPDFRRTLNELQRYAIGGEIDSGILANVVKLKLDDIGEMIIGKKFTDLRKWLGENSDIMDYDNFHTEVYKVLSNWIVPEDVPDAVVIVGEWAYKSQFVVDKEISTMAFLTELMGSCSFKKD